MLSQTSDKDGFDSLDAGGEDCNDDDANIYPALQMSGMMVWIVTVLATMIMTKTKMAIKPSSGVMTRQPVRLSRCESRYVPWSTR